MQTKRLTPYRKISYRGSELNIAGTVLATDSFEVCGVPGFVLHKTINIQGWTVFHECLGTAVAFGRTQRLARMAARDRCLREAKGRDLSPGACLVEAIEFKTQAILAKERGAIGAKKP